MTKSTRRALLSSVVALVICLTMLIGTTFAWFTDTASTAVNTIKSGNLDVEVYHKVGDDWERIEDATKLFTNVDGEEILWEPGVTAKETFKIVNEGNLALKYQFYLGYFDATETADGKTLADVLTCGIEDYVPEYEITSLEDTVTYGVLNETDEENEFTVYITWKPGTNDNDYNVKEGLSIDFAITVVATQVEYEYDSIDNTYDAEAEYPVYVPVGGLDTTENSGNVTTIENEDLFSNEVIPNAYVIGNGTYLAQKDFATFNETYSTIWIHDVDVSCKTLLCALKANNTIVLSDCKITIADGGHLIEELSGAPTQVIFVNVTINGEKVTNSNLQSIFDEYCTGDSVWGFVNND